LVGQPCGYVDKTPTKINFFRLIRVLENTITLASF